MWYVQSKDIHGNEEFFISVFLLGIEPSARFVSTRRGLFFIRKEKNVSSCLRGNDRKNEIRL